MAKILICDDAAFMRMTIREALERGGHEIIAEAENPKDAINLYTTHNPDLVTMDLLMKTPGINAIKQIIKINPTAKIVIITVLNEQEAEVVDAVRAGALGIVTKPINRELLVSEVNRVLEK